MMLRTCDCAGERMEVKSQFVAGWCHPGMLLLVDIPKATVSGGLLRLNLRVRCSGRGYESLCLMALQHSLPRPLPGFSPVTDQ